MPYVVQAYCGSTADVLAVKYASGLLQSVAISAPAFTLGIVLFNETSATSVAVHPFTGFVTVRVYAPAWSTSIPAAVAEDLNESLKERKESCLVEAQNALL